MPTRSRQYEVISVSLPYELVQRTKTLIPRNRRSRVISRVLGSFLDAIARKQLEREYAGYYANRSAREVQEERDLLTEWELTDAEAWAILEGEESGGHGSAR